MKRTHRRAALHVALSTLTVAILAACGGSDDDDDVGTAQITVLSNRADLVSGGDALVQVTVPDNAEASQLAVTLNGTDITGSFTNDAANNRLVGLVSGLVEGENQLVATARGQSAGLTITNHARGASVISGPQLEPWICATRNGDDPC